MAKKRKTAKRKKPTSYMMVIRVNVPARLTDLLAYRVLARAPGGHEQWDLEILNAYYDRRGHTTKSARYADR